MFTTYEVQKTKMPIKPINKLVTIRELVLENNLIFLIEAYLKPVLGNSWMIDHCKIDLYNIYIKLHRICIEV